MKPHKHAELIKAWADGQAEVEYRYPKDDGSLSLWKDLTQCVFHDWYEYRIKHEPKPDNVMFCKSTPWGVHSESGTRNSDHNLKQVFDGETGKLKGAEVLE